GRFRDLPTPQMIMAVPLSIHIGFNIPQALPPGKLSHQQTNKLAPATDLAQPLPYMVLIGQLLELMSREDLQYLGKNRVSMRQGLIPLGFTVFVRTPIVSTCW